MNEWCSEKSGITTEIVTTIILASAAVGLLRPFTFNIPSIIATSRASLRLFRSGQNIHSRYKLVGPKIPEGGLNLFLIHQATQAIDNKGKYPQGRWSNPHWVVKRRIFLHTCIDIACMTRRAMPVIYPRPRWWILEYLDVSTPLLINFFSFQLQTIKRKR